jgi:hypothetical protein
MDDEAKWTLGQIREAGYYLWATCHPDHTRGHIFMLDIEQLIEKFGADFNILGTRLSANLYCPHCGAQGNARVGVGSRRAGEQPPRRVRTIQDGYNGMGGPTDMGRSTLEEATQAALALNAEARAAGNVHQQREDERVKAAIEKARAAKERRRRNNPYDFS